MDITPLIDTDQKIIQSYSEGQFRISGEIYKTPVLVAPHYATEWLPSVPFEFDDFQPLVDIADSLDVILVGTGDEAMFLEPALKKALREKGLHIECMDTGAACRTYNVLMSEARRVVAALIPVN